MVNEMTTTTTYECEFCGKEFYKQESAEDCEASHHFITVECVENRHGNGNFTVGKLYELNLNSGIITCNFIRCRFEGHEIKDGIIEVGGTLCSFKEVKT